jgi:hypothetical protein
MLRPRVLLVNVALALDISPDHEKCFFPFLQPHFILSKLKRAVTATLLLTTEVPLKGETLIDDPIVVPLQVLILSLSFHIVRRYPVQLALRLFQCHLLSSQVVRPQINQLCYILNATGGPKQLMIKVFLLVLQILSIKCLLVKHFLVLGNFAPNFGAIGFDSFCFVFESALLSLEFAYLVSFGDRLVPKPARFKVFFV